MTAFQDRAGLEVVWEAAAAKHSLHQLQLWWEMWLEHENRREQMRLALDPDFIARLLDDMRDAYGAESAPPMGADQ